MTAAFEIRALRADQWALLREVRLRALADAPEAFAEDHDEVAARPEAYWVDIAARDAAGDEATCVLAFVGGTPVGMAVGTDAGDADARQLVAMWVDPSVRGGAVAAGLLDAVADWARARGAHILVAGVRRGNARATEFYRRRGFTDSDPTRPRPGHLGACDLLLECALR